jgi:hypothetical protein
MCADVILPLQRACGRRFRLSRSWDGEDPARLKDKLDRSGQEVDNERFERLIGRSRKCAFGLSCGKRDCRKAKPFATAPVSTRPNISLILDP